MSRTLIVTLASALLVGCGGSAAVNQGFTGRPTVKATRNPDGSLNDHSRCDWKNRPDREATETAGPGVVQPNVRRVYALIGQGDQRTKVLVCRETDSNGDGVKDVVRRYNDKGEVLHEEVDTDHDGKIDTWLTFAKGRVTEERRDKNRDGKPDVWIFSTNGVVARARRDTNFNGKPDVWEIYRNGVLERMGVDLDNDERVDRWDYDTDLRKALDEEDRKKEQALRDAQDAARKANEEKTRKEMEAEAAAIAADPKRAAAKKAADEKKAAEEKKAAAKKAAEEKKAAAKKAAEEKKAASTPAK